MITEDIVRKQALEKKLLSVNKKALSVEEKRQISRWRAQELKDRIEDYLEAREKIPAGLERVQQVEGRKKRILSLLGATEEDWQNWHWQLANRITR
ncbi:MAG: hypothetical protein GX767_00900, partial [Firmicutes bacterium]|nr:hypothetical protein [Bacillota bacterium]